MKLAYYLPSPEVREQLAAEGFYPHVWVRTNKDDSELRDIELRLQHTTRSTGPRCVVKLGGCTRDLPEHDAIDAQWLAQLRLAKNTLFGDKEKP